MRYFILSVSADRESSPLRNTVLAHAGYGVIPANSAGLALDILSNRYVSAMVIANSISAVERRRLCSEGRRLGIPSVVLDQYQVVADHAHEVHVDPLDGPEVVLEALARTLQKASAKAKAAT